MMKVGDPASQSERHASSIPKGMIEQQKMRSLEVQLDVSRLLPQPLQEQVARDCEEVFPHGGHLDGFGRSPHAHKRFRSDVLGFSALANFQGFLGSILSLSEKPTKPCR